MKAADKAEVNEANAMAVATVDAQGRPNVRMVLLKDFDHRGFVFYTNTQSAKGNELAAHSVAALCFHWKSQRRQVRVRGPVTPVSEAEADAYSPRVPRTARSAPGRRRNRARWKGAGCSRRRSRNSR